MDILTACACAFIIIIIIKKKILLLFFGVGVEGLGETR
jgi:hypothetical protein